MQARSRHASLINFDNSNKLIQDIADRNITYEEALNKMADINDNFAKVTKIKSFNPNQIKVTNTYFMVSEIFTGETKKIMENDEGEFYFFNQKVIILMNKNNQHSNEMNNHKLQIYLIYKVKNLLRKEKNRKQKELKY